MNLNSFQPYLLRIKSELAHLSSMQYFEPVVAIIVFIIFFLIGRKSYESKFTAVLNTINDSENEKKRLKSVSDSKKQSLRGIKMKSTFFKMFTAVIILGVAAYSYMKKFDPLIAIAAGSGIVVFWTVILIWEKYLESSIKSTDEKLQKKLLSSQNDAKEIIALLGEDLCKQLKIKFERQTEVQARTEELKDCDLKKCYDQKSIYKDLYLLYKEIIGEMQKMQWCDTCAQQLNTDANQIKLAEFESRLKNYKGLSERLNLEKKKELTNKLLEQWQILEGKLPFMCKRGCCTKFRHSLDFIKKAYHDRLKSLKNRLALIK